MRGVCAQAKRIYMAWRRIGGHGEGGVGVSNKRGLQTHVWICIYRGAKSIWACAIFFNM